MRDTGQIAVRLDEIAADMQGLSHEWQTREGERARSKAMYELSHAKALAGANGSSAEDRKAEALLRVEQQRISLAGADGAVEGCKARYRALDAERSILQTLLNKDKADLTWDPGTTPTWGAK